MYRRTYDFFDMLKIDRVTSYFSLLFYEKIEFFFQTAAILSKTNICKDGYVFFFILYGTFIYKNNDYFFRSRFKASAYMRL